MAETKQINRLPYNGKVHEPPELKSQVVFILVHHYGGNNRTLHRHIKLVNSMGYKAVSFELEGAHKQKMFIPPISKNFKWGLRHIWADRIEEILNCISGEKIIFTLSNPSYSALDAIYRLKAKNIKAIICDGGPFFDIYKSYWNLFTYAIRYNFLIRIFQTFFGAIYWNTFNYKQNAKKYIKSFSDDIPLLSIRAEQDMLVAEKSIDKCLSTYNKKLITKIIIPEAAHLMGIKKNKKIYRQSILKFLIRHQLYNN